MVYISPNRCFFWRKIFDLISPRPFHGLEESLGAGTGNAAGAKVGVEKSTADKVCAVEGGGGARGSGVGDRREKSGVFEGEEGIGKVGEGLANARETG